MNELITAELIENTYLFCLKRVSDTEAAKDLSQDILCAALGAAGRGRGIKDFYAWYWRMARNKYADYIRRKKNPALPLESVEGAVSDHFDPAKTLITSEELSALNYSLSRLAAVQRELVIRYYLKEQTVEQIARELDIPAGTVKYRLSEARKNIKERLDDMNTYGKSSYAPAEVVYFCGYSAGEAARVMHNNIAQQAMIMCRYEPMGVNDIADEIGVAPVYLEPVLRQMEGVSLVKRRGKDKYIANHCVFPMQAYHDAEYEAYKVYRSGNYSEKIYKTLGELKDTITSLSFYGNDFDYSYLMWVLSAIAGDKFGIVGTKKYLQKYGDRYPDEEERFYRSYRMTVKFMLPDENITWHNIKATTPSHLHETFDTPNILEYTNEFDAPPFPMGGVRNSWVNAANITLLEALTENPEKTLNKCEEEQAAKFIEHGLLEKRGNSLSVMLPLINRDIFEKINTIIENAIKPYSEEFSEQAGECVENILLPFVRKDLMSNFIHWDMRLFFKPTAYLLYYGLNDPELLYKPTDYSRSTAGLYIIRYYRDNTSYTPDNTHLFRVKK